MRIEVPSTGIVKEQSVDLDKDVIAVYGYNNSGKTTFLKAVSQVFYNKLMESYLLEKEGILSVYIPTDRLSVSDIQTKTMRLDNLEDFIHYQKDAQKNYSLHLKRVRDYLMQSAEMTVLAGRIIYEVFGIKIEDLNVRYSDGIENVINIFFSIIWAMTWNVDVKALTEQEVFAIISEKDIYVLIDEIEMFLHVNVQSRLINCLKSNFKNCHFILTTHSPLLLTRYRDMAVYCIQDGELLQKGRDLFYEDLDFVYEQLFEVQELPGEVREDITYLGRVIMGREKLDRNRMHLIEQRLEGEYPNLFRKYNKIFVKAQNAGEKNGRHQKGKCT